MAYLREIPALYDIARQITLDAGMPWTDPRTGKTHQPPKKAKRRKARKGKLRGK